MHEKQKLQKVEQQRAILYTLEGVCPLWVMKLYCPGNSLTHFHIQKKDLQYYKIGCNTSYHHNYSVYKDVHSYYPDLPEIIEVADHHYIARKVINMWTMDMNIAWYALLNV